MEGLTIRILELVHCVEAEFGVGGEGLNKEKKSKKTYLSKSRCFCHSTLGPALLNLTEGKSLSQSK